MTRDIKSTLRLNEDEDKALQKIVDKFNIGNNKIDAIRTMIMDFEKKEKQLEELRENNRSLSRNVNLLETQLKHEKSIIEKFRKTFKEAMGIV